MLCGDDTLIDLITWAHSSSRHPNQHYFVCSTTDTIIVTAQILLQFYSGTFPIHQLKTKLILSHTDYLIRPTLLYQIMCCTWPIILLPIRVTYVSIGLIRRWTRSRNV